MVMTGFACGIQRPLGMVYLISSTDGVSRPREVLMASPAPAALTDWSASNALVAVMVLVAGGGLLLFLSGRHSRRARHPAAPSPAPASGAVNGDAPAGALLRLSRLTSLALLGSAAMIGLRVADGHGEEAAPAAAAVAPPSIGALGRGTAPLVPDTAVVVVGLDGRWPTLSEAPRRVDAAVEAAVAAGADPADIRTVAYLVTPVQGVRPAGAPAGLEAVQLIYQVALTVRDLSRLDGVIAAATEAGVTVSGVGVGVADPAAAAATARARAVADSRARAGQIAAALGVAILHADSTEELLANLPASPLALAVADPATPPPAATGEVAIEIFVRFAVG